MSWTNGNVLVVKGLNGKEVRGLIQDGHLTLVSDGASLDPVTMRMFGEYLIEGAEELTRDA